MSLGSEGPNDDDAERLVLADRLLAAGDPRGELIVVQCELERGGLSRERGVSLQRRELELLEAHEEAWAGLEGLARNWTFRRGFVDEITIDATRFAEREEEIWRRAPRLRWLRFHGLGYDSPVDDLDDAAREWDRVRPRLERALASGRVRHFSAEDARVTWMHDGTMTRYRQSGSLDDALARWLVAEPALLGRLRGLGLVDASPAVLGRLAGSEATAGLDELELRGDLHDPALPSLARTRLRPQRLALLDSRSRSRSRPAAALGALLATPLASRVTDLSVTRHAFVAESACAPQLRSLAVTDGEAGEAFSALTTSPRLARLEHLSIDGDLGPRSDAELDALFSGASLGSLRTLQLGPGLPLEAARRLLGSPLARRLSTIDLRHSSPAYGPDAEALRGLWDGCLLLARTSTPTSRR